MTNTKLLIIEDEELQLEALKERFKRRKQNCYGATDFPEAIQILEKNNDIFCILTDYNLPSMTAVDFLKKRQNLPINIQKIPVILQTAQPADYILPSTPKNTEIIGYFRKPFDFKTLFNFVQTIQTNPINPFKTKINDYIQASDPTTAQNIVLNSGCIFTELP